MPAMSSAALPEPSDLVLMAVLSFRLPRDPEDTLVNRHTAVSLTPVHATFEHVIRDVVHDHFRDALITALDRLMSLGAQQRDGVP